MSNNWDAYWLAMSEKHFHEGREHASWYVLFANFKGE